MQRALEPGEPCVVVYVIAGLACGGAEMVLLELVRGLDRKRFRPVVVSLKGPDVLSEQFRAAGVDVHHFDMVRAASTPLIIARVARLARKLHPGILHGVMFYGDIVCRVLRLLEPKVRVVGALHSTYIGPPFYTATLRLTDPLVDAVTAVSEVVATEHRTIGTAGRDKLLVIPNGIDESRFRPPSLATLTSLRQKYRVEGARVILTVGRVEKEKNHALLLRSFAQLDVPDAVLMIVGDGSMRSSLERQSEELGIASRVRFLGHVAPVNPLFHLADVFALSSDVEGLPLVILEAMAAGVPMVLTSVGGIPDVVKHEETALLVPPRQDVQLSRAIKKMLLLEEGERAQFSARARAAFRARFSMQRMVDDTQTLYEALLRGESPVRATTHG